MFNFVLIKKSGKYTLFGILPSVTRTSYYFEEVNEVND